MKTLNLTDDTIDVRDLIERFEELESELGCDDEVTRAVIADESLSARRHEFKKLEALLNELEGQGGDEQWRDNWYPMTLIRDSYFVDYTKEMLEDCGTLPRDLPTWIEIDWNATARNVQIDYTTAEIDGVTYYYR